MMTCSIELMRKMIDGHVNNRYSMVLKGFEELEPELYMSNMQVKDPMDAFKYLSCPIQL